MATINFSEFKPTVAVVDWVSILVEFKDKSHGGYLKNHYASFGVSYADPLDKGEGGAASRFEIRIQSPASFATIEGLLSELEGRYGFIATPEILAVEVSADFYHRHSDPASLSKMTEHLMMRIVPPVIHNPRLIGAWCDTPILLPTQKALDPTRTLYIGNVKDDCLWRVYWKRTDETFVGEDNKREPKPLPPNEHRARVEVRLTGKALAELSLFGAGDLNGFRFERLHTLGLFKFAKLKAGCRSIFTNKYAVRAATALGVAPHSPACSINQFGLKRRGRIAQRVLNKNLQTDTILTEKVRNALRELSNRF